MPKNTRNTAVATESTPAPSSAEPDEQKEPDDTLSPQELQALAWSLQKELGNTGRKGIKYSIEVNNKELIFKKSATSDKRADALVEEAVRGLNFEEDDPYINPIQEHEEEPNTYISRYIVYSTTLIDLYGQMPVADFSVDLWFSFMRVITQNLFDAIEYLHKNGFGHFDIKPGNVIVGLNGDVKLIDLENLTPLSALPLKVDKPAGTVGYIDPIVEDQKTLTPYADIWSVGICLYFLLAFRMSDQRRYFKQNPNRYSFPQAVIDRGLTKFNNKKGIYSKQYKPQQRQAIYTLLKMMLVTEKRPSLADIKKCDFLIAPKQEELARSQAGINREIHNNISRHVTKGMGKM